MSMPALHTADRDALFFRNSGTSHAPMLSVVAEGDLLFYTGLEYS